MICLLRLEGPVAFSEQNAYGTNVFVDNREIQAMVAQDAPFVPLDYPPYIFATGGKVNGFAVNPGGAYRLENVWLS